MSDTGTVNAQEHVDRIRSIIDTTEHPGITLAGLRLTHKPR